MKTERFLVSLMLFKSFFVVLRELIVFLIVLASAVEYQTDVLELVALFAEDVSPIV